MKGWGDGERSGSKGKRGPKSGAAAAPVPHLNAAQLLEFPFALRAHIASPDGTLHVDAPAVDARVVQAQRRVHFRLAPQLHEGHAARAAATLVREQADAHGRLAGGQKVRLDVRGRRVVRKLAHEQRARHALTATTALLRRRIVDFRDQSRPGVCRCGRARMSLRPVCH
eukprot:scaffold19179_cov123-Isochrysis_galbana.AAC.2